MKAGRASRTAEHNALFRALESSRPDGSRRIDDPLARRFLTRPYTLVARVGAWPGFGALVPWYIDRRWPGVRTSVVARTRLIDDLVARSAGAVEQAVLLGAGYDSRAYRMPALRGLPLFEVDHPDTQAAKRRALQRALGALPGNVRFVATDFTRRDLEARMAEAGYREGLPTLVLWEGVTNYLTGEAVDATLRWCARAGAGSRVIFTYIHRDALVRPEAFAGTKRVFAALDRAGERFTFGLDPAELEAFLAQRGLTLESDVGAAAYRERCYGEAARRMRGHEFYRVAVARVA